MCKVKLKIEEELEVEDTFGYVIFLGEKDIGSITAFHCGDGFLLELVSIDEKFRGNGYGTIAMNLLKEIAKNEKVAYIRGDSPNNRKNFYRRLGAKYECRDKEDETYLNDVFYIDIER